MTELKTTLTPFAPDRGSTEALHLSQHSTFPQLLLSGSTAFIVIGIKIHYLKDHLFWCLKGTDLAEEVTSAMEKLTANSNNKRIRNSHHSSSH